MATCSLQVLSSITLLFVKTVTATSKEKGYVSKISRYDNGGTQAGNSSVYCSKGE